MSDFVSGFLRRRPFTSRRGLGSKKIAVFLVVVAVAVLLRLWQDRHQPAVPEALDEGTYAVRRVVDGDTLLLENGARIRLMGADTPETVKPNHPVEPFGPQATLFTKNFLSGGRVFLTFDKQRLDRYKRFLAYAWLDESMEQMLNEELIRAGLAEAKTGYRFSPGMKKRFRRAEDEAKSAGRGIWSNEIENQMEIKTSHRSKEH